MNITFFGSGTGSQGEPMYNLMQNTAELLAKLGHTIITGAFTGSGMEAPARGAKNAGGKAIGYAMLGLPGNECLSECHDVAQFLATKPVSELNFTTRLGMLLQSDMFVLGADGGIGSLVEWSAWANLNAKIWKKAQTPKRMVILWAGEKESSPFWKIYATLVELLSEDVRGLIHWCQSAEEVIDSL